jgi:hypothetical protein
VTLTSDEEPLNDGDPSSCYFNYDGSGNNTVDFGFYDPNTSSVKDNTSSDDPWIRMYPMPVQQAFTITGNLSLYHLEIYDAVGKKLLTINANGYTHTVDVSSLPAGMYFVKTSNLATNRSRMQKMIKQ